MTDSANVRHNFARLIAAAMLAMALARCGASGGTADDRMARFLVAPDKFALCNCAALAEKTTATVTRENEMEGLIAKARPGADGRLASSIDYRPEYLELRGDMNELRCGA